MSEKLRAEGRDFAKFLERLSPQHQAEANRRERESADAEHSKFQTYFRAEKCYLCGDELKRFDKRVPCAHWLLSPVGFTKWDFEAVVAKFGCFQLQAFLRWVANEEAFARNINDLRDEGTGKLIELTICYDQFEWSFSCGESDYVGHDSKSEFSRRPHYHFQMRRKKQTFIRFNDFHVPLHDYDIHLMEAMRASPELVRQRFSAGAGMSEVFDKDNLEQFIMSASSVDDEQQALAKIDSIVIAQEGSTISGDDLARIFEEASHSPFGEVGCKAARRNTQFRSCKERLPHSVIR